MDAVYDETSYRILLELIAICVNAVPASVFAGVGLLLLAFGRQVTTGVIVAAGILIGALPALNLFIFSMLGKEPFSLQSNIMLALIIGAFAGGYVALQARDAIRFIIVGCSWIAVLYCIWPGAGSAVTGSMLALVGFFVFGFLHKHLFIIATSAIGTIFLMVALHKILAANYPDAFRVLTAHPATIFAVGAIIAFAGTVIQGTSKKLLQKTEELPVTDAPEPPLPVTS